MGLKKLIFLFFSFLLFYPLTDKFCAEQSVDQSIIDIIVRSVHAIIENPFSEKSDIVCQKFFITVQFASNFWNS